MKLSASLDSSSLSSNVYCSPLHSCSQILQLFLRAGKKKQGRFSGLLVFFLEGFFFLTITLRLKHFYFIPQLNSVYKLHSIFSDKNEIVLILIVYTVHHFIL